MKRNKKSHKKKTLQGGWAIMVSSFIMLWFCSRNVPLNAQNEYIFNIMHTEAT